MYTPILKLFTSIDHIESISYDTKYVDWCIDLKNNISSQKPFNVMIGEIRVLLGV